MKKLVVNCETKSSELVDLTEEEIAKNNEIAAINLKAIEDKENARAALLERLGITEEEAQLLLGVN